MSDSDATNRRLLRDFGLEIQALESQTAEAASPKFPRLLDDYATKGSGGELCYPSEVFLHKVAEIIRNRVSDPEQRALIAKDFIRAGAPEV